MGFSVRKAQLLCLLLLATGRLAQAQWKTQEITLHPGWNAVYLEVEPSSRDIASVFAGIPVESVWTWNRRYNSVEYIQNANDLIPAQEEWLTYLPAGSPNAAASNLFTIDGRRAYLIKLSGASNVVWQVTGIPVVRHQKWVPDSFNLVGFELDPLVPVTFATFFSASAAHAGKKILRLSESGVWQEVAASSTMNRGEAFWIETSGPSDFEGPVRIVLDQGDAVDFARSLNELNITFQNASTSVRTLSAVLQGSAAPPNASQPSLAGPVPLSYYKLVAGTNPGWADLPDPLQVSLSSKGSRSVRLQVRRPDMANVNDPPPTSGPGILYQGLLRVADGTGWALTIPVRSEGLLGQGGGAALARRIRQGVGTTNPRAGLWVGYAVVNAVSEVAVEDNLGTPEVNEAEVTTPVGAPFQFRLIVHVDAGGVSRLLQQVSLLWVDGTTKDSTEYPGNTVVDQPGRFVLMTDDDLIESGLPDGTLLKGSTVRDGETAGRRISTAAFALSAPLQMSGAFEQSLNVTIPLLYDDPLNPYKHVYHPDHNNLDEDDQPTLGVGVESYTISRVLDMQFTQTDPEGFDATISGWGDKHLGGNYAEVISGIHRKDIHVSGVFRLVRVSDVPVLNDGAQ